jgi:hypothetical protein
MIIDVNDVRSQRFQVGLSCLREGGGLRLGRVEFAVADNGVLECRIETQWGIDSLSEQAARAELEIARTTHYELQAASEEFRRIAQRYTARYSIISDDGMGAVEVCRLEKGEIAWSGR